MKYLVGLGFDVHRFTKKKKALILGGVKIPGSKGLLAVSDGDVVLHTITDALCGACGLGDIGDYFPPSASKSKGVDSKIIAKSIMGKISKKFKISNIDVTIITDKPRLVKHKSKIVKSLKNIFSTKNVNLKLKSKEGLNILGGKESIASMAAVVVEKC